MKKVLLGLMMFVAISGVSSILAQDVIISDKTAQRVEKLKIDADKNKIKADKRLEKKIKDIQKKAEKDVQKAKENTEKDKVKIGDKLQTELDKIKVTNGITF